LAKVKARVPNCFPGNFPNFLCQFFLDFFCFIATSGVFQRWEFKNTTKTFCKKIVSKSFYQKFDRKSKTDFFSVFFNLLSRFWAFLGEGSSKTRLEKYRKNKSDPSPFLASDPPTHHGGHQFFFNWRPLGLGKLCRTQGAGRRAQGAGR
jgi:hypothetical protein